MNSAGFLTRNSAEKLLSAEGELRALEAAARRPDDPAGAEIWRIVAQTVEPAQLQGSRISPRDAAGCGAVLQEAVPNH